MDINILDVDSIYSVSNKIKDIGCDEYAIPILASKAILRTILLKNIDNRAANIIKQELLSIGGDAAINRDVSNFVFGKSDILIFATLRQLEKLKDKLSKQPFGLKDLGNKISNALHNYENTQNDIKIPSGSLNIKNKPLIMGVLNVTPDSFSDGGMYLDKNKALDHALSMIEYGADIIDIGGESSRPGAKPISIDEEKSRIIPVLKLILKKTKIPISIDTYKPEVANACLEEGASIINDITAMRFKNGAMAKIVSQYKVPVILMHMKGNPQNMQNNPYYEDVISEIGLFFEKRISFAVSKGISPDKIIIDPGIGFGKRLEDNIEILRRLKEFKIFGKPIALGTSRKSFLGILTGIKDPKERCLGSVISAIWGYLNGANILRVHDVYETIQALKIINAIKQGN